MIVSIGKHHISLNNSPLTGIYAQPGQRQTNSLRPSAISNSDHTLDWHLGQVATAFARQNNRQPSSDYLENHLTGLCNPGPGQTHCYEGLWIRWPRPT